jgi:chromosome segregation protein
MEILGFKSFAEKTVINFEPGITAVVGPNGSGKSNITDALHWVLGEQSAKNLRGGKMFDVIFSGSSKKKSLNVAEVTVILDNSDSYLPLSFQEISLTRRLTRSGDSDFFINKKLCRLKDITDLLLDSGLGKESFSIISQGKVEVIFQSKPEERRAIFEEAAGVLKYKTRKRQAEQKLVETEDNLSRLKDIIHELEEQLPPLLKQKENAVQFIKLRGEFTKIDISLTVSQIREKKEIWETNKSLLLQATITLQQKKESIKELESELQNLRLKRNDFDESLEVVGKELLDITEAEKECEGENNLWQERYANFQKNAEELKESMVAIKAEEKQIFENLKKVKEELFSKQEEASKLEEELAELNGKIAFFSGSSKEKLEELRIAYLSAHEIEIQAQSDLEHLEAQYLQKARSHKKNLVYFEELNQKIEKKRHTLKVTEQEYVKIQKNLQAQLKEYSEMKEQEQLFKEKLHVLEIDRQLMLNLLQEKKAKMLSLREIEESYQGYFHGVRAVLQQKKILGGIVGSVAELLSVNSKYRLAIETVLGQAAQQIVVEDEESARRGVQFLKEKCVGRATFLPLTTIRSRKISEDHRKKLEKISDFLGVGSELIQCSSKVQSIMENLLGNTLLAKNLASANTIARKMNFRYRVVSLKGDVMNAGGSMTGGFSKKGNRTSLFANDAQLQDLGNEIFKLEKQLQDLEEKQTFANEKISKFEKGLEDLRVSGEKSRMAQNNQEHFVQNEQADLLRLQQEKEALEEQQQVLGEFLCHYEEKKNFLAQQIQEAKMEVARTNQERLLVEKSAGVQDEKKSEIQACEQKKKERFAVISEQIRSSSHFLEEEKEKNKLLSERYVMFSGKLTSLQDKMNEQKENQAALSEKLSDLISRRKKLIDLEEEKRFIRMEMVANISKQEEQFAFKNREIQREQQKVSELELIVDRLNNQLDSLLNYLQEEYQETFENACLKSIEIEDIGQAEAKVSRLKREIDLLGVINLAAIEQYDQVSERFSFLEEQQKDLLEAKDSLYRTMSEMDKEVQTRFLEMFEDIREKFSQTFPKMFGGGRAELILTDPENLLLAGVEIIAQPPGKKLQNLSLLSGGERALTALALLFAIIEVRPVPFAVLDEVEAALDEANVGCFANYLSQFEKDTQFIVVTHRRGTMEAAKYLYGVTMQGSGVSKIVSVRLEEVTEDGKIGA